MLNIFKPRKSIQYHHSIMPGAKGGRCVAVDVPDKAYILNKMIDGNPFHLNIGVSLCHIRDSYSRKIGANLADKNIKPVLCRFEFAEPDEGGLMAYFCPKLDQEHDPNLPLQITLRISNKSDIIWYIK